MDVSALKQDEFGGHHWKSDQVRGGKGHPNQESTKTEPPGGSMGDRVAELRAGRRM